jgi:hypothetical protein
MQCIFFKNYICAITIATRLTFPSGGVITWIQLVKHTNKRAIQEDYEHLRRTNHTLWPHLTTRPDPLTRNDQVNGLRPVIDNDSRKHDIEPTQQIATHYGFPVV